LSSAPFADLFVTSADELRLHVRDYSARETARLPVFCLPGLTRTVEDFDVLAPALAKNEDTPRRVIAIDSRGRGLSQKDPKPENYTVPVEAADVLTVADTLGIGRAVVVGTSRGGLIALTIAALRPEFLGGVVFNDVGPALDMAGLMRIKGYAGKIARPRDWDEAVRNHRALFGREFPKLSEAQWQAWARRAWKVVDGRFAGTCDARVADSLAAVTPDDPLPTLWPLYDALKDVPLMAVRGMLSDLLSRETLAEMAARRPDLDIVEVPDEGHAPLLEDGPTIARIAAFVRRCDGI
jgi:pimeloyl-ACP methyl ester carboxylesterase